MDEFPNHPTVTIHRGLIAVALVAALMSGCEQLGLGKSKSNPVVPAPPLRKVPTDSQTKGSEAGASRAVKLDGSASGSESAAAPNAPGIAASQTLAAAVAQGNAAASPSSPPMIDPALAGDSEEAATDADDEPGESANVGQASGPRQAAKPGKVMQVADRGKAGSPQSETVAETGNDVIQPIETEGAGTKLQSPDVAATVNGIPIFFEDVMRGFPEAFTQQYALAEKAMAEGKLSPPEIEGLRGARKTVKMALQQHVDQELLLQALKAKLKKEQLDGFKKQLDHHFDTEYLPAEMKRLGVTTPGELELILQKNGSSIESVRAIFRNRELAREYQRSKSVVHDGFDRPDILKYYHDHREDYAIPAQAKWEQIQIKFAKQRGGKSAAKKKLDEVLERLEAGDVFAVVAKKYSDGPTASKGGLWGFTTRGSYKAPEIDKAIFEQPVGEIGPPIETKASFDIIRVIDRTDAGYKLFETVYDDIKNHLKAAASQRRMAELVKELHENATIETFDDEP
jgi:parvulin-like peptidyl-prolyl isomerase